jgi:hypothetical protein
VILPPWEVAYVERMILKNYDDSVSIMDTLRRLEKFGLNSAISTAYETVWFTGGDETYVSTNAIDSISSSDAADTQDVTITGFVVSGTGASQKFMRVTQTVTLTGQTRAALGTAVARVERLARADGDTLLAGSVYVYENTAIVAGVPTDTTKIHLTVDPAHQQSQKAALTVANNEYLIIDDIGGGVTQKTAATGLMALQLRPPGSVFSTKFNLPVSQGLSDHHFKLGALIIPPNYDVRFRAISSTNNTEFAPIWLLQNPPT